MKAFAKSLCSSIPVAIGRMLGSKMKSSGANPASLGEQPVGALGDADLSLERVGLAILVERHHDDGRAKAPDPSRFSSKSSSPSLS